MARCRGEAGRESRSGHPGKNFFMQARGSTRGERDCCETNDRGTVQRRLLTRTAPLKTSDMLRHAFWYGTPGREGNERLSRAGEITDLQDHTRPGDTRDALRKRCEGRCREQAGATACHSIAPTGAQDQVPNRNSILEFRNQLERRQAARQKYFFTTRGQETPGTPCDRHPGRLAIERPATVPRAGGRHRLSFHSSNGGPLPGTQSQKHFGV